MLSSVVLLAIDDACLAPDRIEVRRARNLNALARSGLHFLFHPESAFHWYAALLDLDVGAVRAGLRARAWATESERALALRARLTWLGNPRRLELPPQDVIDKLAARSRPITD